MPILDKIYLIVDETTGLPIFYGPSFNQEMREELEKDARSCIVLEPALLEQIYELVK